MVLLDAALERLLEKEEFPGALIERARRLRHRIVELGLSKYAVGDIPLQRRSADKPHLLVTGQVEDDMLIDTSMVSGSIDSECAEVTVAPVRSSPVPAVTTVGAKLHRIRQRLRAAWRERPDLEGERIP